MNNEEKYIQMYLNLYLRGDLQNEEIKEDLNKKAKMLGISTTYKEFLEKDRNEKYIKGIQYASYLKMNEDNENKIIKETEEYLKQMNLYSIEIKILIENLFNITKGGSYSTYNKNNDNPYNEKSTKSNKSNIHKKNYNDIYKEPLITSIKKGFTFYPNLMIKPMRFLCESIGKFDMVIGAYIFAYVVSFYTFIPWMICSIIVTLIRIFVFPILKENNIIEQ